MAAVITPGCGFYFKTYRSREPFPFIQGMTENDVLSQWGSPLSVQITGPMQVWRYFADEPVYGKKKTYTLVWFQEGKVVKWETKTEENLPPQPVS